MEAKWPLMGTDFGQFETSPLEFRRSLITKFNNQNKNKKSFLFIQNLDYEKSI